jgi:hypothetical protein
MMEAPSERQYAPVSSTTNTLYLNNTINKSKIARRTQLVINKSRNSQAQVQEFSKTTPVYWRLFQAHSGYGKCQQARKDQASHSL